MSALDEKTHAQTRCAKLGVVLSDAQWSALPAPAREHLVHSPIKTGNDRRVLRVAAQWMMRAFPAPQAV